MSEKTKILVVDDDPATLSATRRLLDKAGYQTFPAQTGLETLDAARRHRPDLILLDVNLPDMDGFEVCRRLKADPELASIGVIIVSSAYTDGESQAAGLDLGADGYIARPVSNRELLARIQTLLRLRAAEQAARLSAAEWQATFDAVSSGIFLTDDAYRIIQCNRAMSELFGEPCENMLGKTCYQVVHSAAEPYYACPLMTVKKEKKRQSMIFERGGRWLEVTVDPLIDAEGRFAGSVHVINDITERKQAEERLQESEERHRAISELISDYAYSFRVEEGNRLVREWVTAESFTRITGYTLQEMDERGGWASIIYPDDMPIALARAKRLFAGQHDVSEFRIVRKDGTIRWLRDHGHPIFDDVQQRVIRIYGAAQDITDRKQAEENLRQSEETYRNLFQNAQVGLFRTRITDGKILESNEQLARMFGYDSREEFIAEYVTSQNYVDPSTRERMVEMLRRDGFVQNFEARFYRKDRSIFWARYSARVYPEQGWIEGVAEDVTQQKQAEDEIRRLNAELEQRVAERTRQLQEAQEQLVRQEKLAVLGQLAGSVGHELRNPLAVINNAVYFLNLILPEADEKVKEYLNIIARETHNAEKIVGDLLDFARVKSVDREAVAASELVRRVLDRYPPPENIILHLDLPPGLPPLWVDPRQIEQVLGNLIVNAYQAMEEGGRLSVISDRWTVNSDQWLRIAVKDTGPGIPPENMGKLFEPLFTTKAKGIGLGLAVSKKLVEANGGRIEVQSEPGQGATFTLILPLAEEKSS